MESEIKPDARPDQPRRIARAVPLRAASRRAMCQEGAQRRANREDGVSTMVARAIIVGGLAVFLAACSSEPRPIINTGSYDWADQVKDAQGYPLPGWGVAVSPNGGDGAGGMR